MMMSQVAGRAGRKQKRGLVILQTKQKDLPVVHQVVNNDYTALYKDLIAERQAFRYPPYYRLIYVFLRHRQDNTVQTAAELLGAQLRQWFGGRVLGPDKPSVAKVKQQNIRTLVLKLEPTLDMKRVREYLLMAQRQLLADRRYTSLQVFFDVDPQ
jgi:primosomal protein N' (replication factor Y)